jgi:hypothetical protein
MSVSIKSSHLVRSSIDGMELTENQLPIFY